MNTPHSFHDEYFDAFDRSPRSARPADDAFAMLLSVVIMLASITAQIVLTGS
jgi:hypothetical protein